MNGILGLNSEVKDLSLVLLTNLLEFLKTPNIRFNRDDKLTLDRLLTEIQLKSNNYNTSSQNRSIKLISNIIET